MALIKCPECEKEISDKAITCPNCGMPLRDEIRGTYNLIIKRTKQKFLINPAIKVTVDVTNNCEIKNGEEITVPLTSGKHTILFACGPRKTQAEFEIMDNALLTVSFNRVSGEIDVVGSGIKTENNSPNFTVGVGVGGLFGGER